MVCSVAPASSYCSPSGNKQDCYDAGGYCIGYGDSHDFHVLSVGDQAAGASRLSQLFARSLRTWTLNPSTNRYDIPVLCGDAPAGGQLLGTSADFGCWDMRWTYGSSSRPVVGDITVNGAAGGTVTARPGQAVELRFTSRLDLDHKPLQYICIDWGDGSNLCGTGSKLNIDHQPNPASGHRFTHTYASAGTFQPKIQIEDNWGFCNGGGTYVLDQDAPDATGACHNASGPGTPWDTAPATIDVSGPACPGGICD
jgi:hypothetical protein